jgi:hypothetical protein
MTMNTAERIERLKRVPPETTTTIEVCALAALFDTIQILALALSGSHDPSDARLADIAFTHLDDMTGALDASDAGSTH